MTPLKVRIGTRGSQLALTQSRHVADLLRRHDPTIETEVVIVQTQGDHVLDAPLAQIGGKGVFTKEIEHALLSSRIDLAVHSLKDLPTQNPEGLRVACIPVRESPRDLLVTPGELDLADLKPGEIVGTSSLRRAAQLRAKYPNVEIKDIRGNVPTRIRKMTDGNYAAIVLAEAGVRRLNLNPPCARPIEPEEMLPAPGQGALGLQIRAEDDALAAALAPLNDAATEACCVAERTLLDRLGGGCQVPLGALGEILPDGRLRLRGRVVPLDGSRVVNCDLTGSMQDPVALGEEAAEQLRGNGAAEIIEKALHIPPGTPIEDTAEEAEKPEIRVVVTRDEDADGPLSRLLREHGLIPVCLPLIRTRLIGEGRPLRDGLEKLPEPDWVIISSGNAVEALSAAPHALEKLRRCRFAVVGSSTAGKLERLDVQPEIIGTAGREDLLERLLPRMESGAKCLVLSGNLSPGRVPSALTDAGAKVLEIEVYETTRVPENGPLLAQLLAAGECHAVTFCSASSVEAFADLVKDARAVMEERSVLCVSIGGSTTAALKAAKLDPVHEAAEPSFARIAEELAARFSTA